MGKSARARGENPRRIRSRYVIGFLVEIEELSAFRKHRFDLERQVDAGARSGARVTQP